MGSFEDLRTGVDVTDIARDYPDITQVIVPGRGIEPNSSGNLAGTVRRGSKYSGDSYARAATAACVAIALPDCQVILSGKYSFALPANERPDDTSEASAMRDVMVNHFEIDPGRITVEEDSLSTYGNFTHMHDKDLLVPGEPALVVAQPDHMPRILDVAQMVYPDTTFVPYPAPDGTPEGVDSTAADRIAKLAYRMGMLGVRAGDVETIARRDRMVQKSLWPALALRDSLSGWQNRQQTTS